MSATRLFILGMLARGGPMHGHQIRRGAQEDRTELWADVKPGSLYGALHRMAADGLIEAVRTEQEGNLPQRTVYGITQQGQEELSALRLAILRDSRIRTDPVDLALVYTDDMPRDELRELVQTRRDKFAAEHEGWRKLREEAAPHLVGLEPLGFDHTLMRLAAEIDWHDRLLDELGRR
ncbi:MAG TPA: PadR family transcriptional regulator [Lentzea sp.]